MFDYTTLQSVEKQFKETTIQAIDFGHKFYTQAFEQFDKNTNGTFNIYTLKAADAVDTFTETVKSTLEKFQITELLRSGVKK
jgi:hypothetical protein